MSNNPFEDVTKRIKKSLAKRKAGPRQLLIGVGMFVVVTTLLAVNLIPTEHVREPFSLVRLAGVALLVFGILVFSGIFLYDYRPYAFSQPQLLLLLGSLFVAITALAKVMSVLAIAGNSYWGFLIPVAFVAMLVTLLFDPYLAIMLVISSSIVVGYVMYGDFYYTMTALLGGMVAVYTTTGIEERTELTRAGIITGLSMAFFAFTAGFLKGSASSALMNGIVGFLNGLFSAILALGTLPFLEKHLGILTPMRLLELSNPNQPLLRRLMTEAPGTYGHSVGVGNLAEAAAEATGANALLVRVGAYYHDIGKLKRPAFFIENQAGNGSKHENINPKLSTLVITSHVKEGVELGREAGLPQRILDLIDEHHGRSIVTFFYHQEKKDKKGKAVNDNDFRYNGEKPKSREAGILMLADAMEAASKTVKHPSISRFETLAKHLVQERIDDGQLNESDMTLADMDKVVKSFAATLAGIYHKRVAYPDLTADDTRVRRQRQRDDG